MRPIPWGYLGALVVKWVLAMMAICFVVATGGACGVVVTAAAGFGGEPWYIEAVVGA